jgi:hypothetical protein
MQTHFSSLSVEMREALSLLDCPPPPPNAAPSFSPAGPPPDADDDGAVPARILKTLPLNSGAFGGLEEGMFPGHHAQPVLDAIGSVPARIARPPPLTPARPGSCAVSAVGQRQISSSFVLDASESAIACPLARVAHSDDGSEDTAPSPRSPVHRPIHRPNRRPSHRPSHRPSRTLIAAASVTHLAGGGGGRYASLAAEHWRPRPMRAVYSTVALAHAAVVWPDRAADFLLALRRARPVRAPVPLRVSDAARR